MSFVRQKSAFLFLLFFASVMSGCTKNTNLANLTTTEPYHIYSIEAMSGGVILDDGGNEIINKGVVWSTSPSPTINLETKTIELTSLSKFRSWMNGLKESTTYYVRAYATTISGTSYGNELVFKTNTINLKKGLVAFYPFSRNANDNSGNNNNGIVNGATLTNDRFGIPDNAFDFDGIDDNIIIENSQSLNPSSISISGWFSASRLPTDPNGGANAIISKWYQQLNCSNNSDNYTIQITNNNGRNLIAAATSKNPLLSNAITTDFVSQFQNKWIHFIFIHDALNGQKFYINGNLVNSNAIKGGLCSTTNPLYIGADARQNLPLWRHMKGKIDDIRIYDRVLNEEEIKYLSEN